MARMIRWSALAAAVALTAAACGGGEAGGGEEAALDQPISVGSKEFTEQLLLGEMTIQALESHGFETEDNTGITGTATVRQALTSGEIDVYWEYTGTAWFTHFAESEVIPPEEMYSQVKQRDVEQNNLVWLETADFNNTYTLMVQEQNAEEIGTTLSALGDYVEQNPDAVVCINEEFAVRPDGLPALVEHYGFNFQNVRQMTTGLTYGALAEGECDVAMGFATDGRIARLDLINLEDDQNFFPAYRPAAVIRQEIVEQAPQVGDILNCVAGSLDTAIMTELNARVDSDGESVEAVATDHLQGTDCLGDQA